MDSLFYLNINIHRSYLDIMMIKFDCQSDRIQNDHGKKSLAMSMIDDLVQVISRKIYPKCEWYIPWVGVPD